MDASVNRILPSIDERALLIGMRISGQGLENVEDSLDELKLLVSTAGALTVEARIVKRERIDPGTILGKGYLAELRDYISQQDVKLLVFDLNNIRPAQVRNLEEILKCRVVGRTEIILDIFAQRARSSESKIQVELAQLRYILPRLKGLGGVLSRLGGGIGTRGPGEKMLETDRRHVLKRISVLKSKLDRIAEHRKLIRKSRSTECLGAVVGYTNAGKSTLINHLAKDDLFVEDRLFATLDSYTRMVYLGENRKVLLTDTVGFIRNLPANLIESFKSTLEEINNADFLLHVVDITSRDIANNITTVNDELAQLGCTLKPLIIFFNKSDKLKDGSQISRVLSQYPDAIVGSAYTGENMERLKHCIDEMCDIPYVKIKAKI